MGHVVLDNGAKVTSKEIVGDIALSSLLLDLSAYNELNQVRACKALGSIGCLARPAIPSLTKLAYDYTNAHSTALTTVALESLAMIDSSFRNLTMLKKPTESSALRAKPLAKPLTVVAPTITTKTTTVKRDNVKIDIVQSANVELSTRKCNFCEKETIFNEYNRSKIEKLCQPNKFYCEFCLRHGFNAKSNKDIMIISFRGIVGYYYYELCNFPKSPTMFTSEIKDYIELHKQVGLTNPLFIYDPESMCWFIDFRRVGDTKKKLPVYEIVGTVVEILAAFNLHQNCRATMHKLFLKFQEAIMDFYERRFRPPGKKLCIPTLKGCGFPEWGGSSSTAISSNRMPLEDTRSFLPLIMDYDKYWNKTT